MGKASETVYETNQNRNPLTRFLHSTRYRELRRHMDALAAEIQDRPIRVLDIGCGPASAVGTLLAGYEVEYVGIDYDPIFIRAAREKFGHRDDCKFILGDASDRAHYIDQTADIVIALEALEHIPANRVVDIVEYVCTVVRPQVFLVTVPVEVGPAVWIKNWGSALMGYDRRSGNVWETFWAGLYQLDRVPPHNGSHQGFDWRWLAQTMRVNAPLKTVKSLPFGFLPRWCAPNVALISYPSAAAATARVQDWHVNHAAFLAVAVLL